jgi:ribonuclease HI
VIRNSAGGWLAGFAFHIGGITTSLRAELWGILKGLELAKERGFRNVCLEVDSQSACQLISGFSNETSVWNQPLLEAIRRLAFSFADFSVQHVYREAKRCADWLANHAYSLPIGCHVYHQAPFGLSSILLGDVIGISIPRLWFIAI